MLRVFKFLAKLSKKKMNLKSDILILDKTNIRFVFPFEKLQTLNEHFFIKILPLCMIFFKKTPYFQFFQLFLELAILVKNF